MGMLSFGYASLAEQLHSLELVDKHKIARKIIRHIAGMEETQLPLQFILLLDNIALNLKKKKLRFAYYAGESTYGLQFAATINRLPNLIQKKAFICGVLLAQLYGVDFSNMCTIYLELVDKNKFSTDVEKQLNAIYHSPVVSIDYDNGQTAHEGKNPIIEIVSKLLLVENVHSSSISENSLKDSMTKPDDDGIIASDPSRKNPCSVLKQAYKELHTLIKESNTPKHQKESSQNCQPTLSSDSVDFSKTYNKSAHQSTPTLQTSIVKKIEQIDKNSRKNLYEKICQIVNELCWEKTTWNKTSLPSTINKLKMIINNPVRSETEKLALIVKECTAASAVWSIVRFFRGRHALTHSFYKLIAEIPQYNTHNIHSFQNLDHFKVKFGNHFSAFVEDKDYLQQTNQSDNNTSVQTKPNCGTQNGFRNQRSTIFDDGSVVLPQDASLLAYGHSP